MRRVSYLLAILSAVLLTACASFSSNADYESMPRFSGQGSALLTGSQVPQPEPFASQTAYVARIDGVLVDGGKNAFYKPFNISTGNHEVVVIWNQAALYARAAFALKAETGMSYVVRHERLENNKVRIWIENEVLGVMASEPQVVQADDLTPGSSSSIGPAFMQILRLR